MTPVSAAQRFDPYAILGAMQRARVDYLLIGGLARVIQGSDEVTRGVDLVPSRRLANLERLEAALQTLGIEARRRVVNHLVHEPAEPLRLDSPVGVVRIVLEPAGTRGYEDLRRKASRAALGDGLRPQVAASGDLVRMLEALGRPDQLSLARTMRRVVELDRGLEIER